MKLINLEQRSAVNQNNISVILTCQINSEDKSFVFVLGYFKKGNRFARAVLWRVRKPIGNVKVNVRTVNIGISIGLYAVFIFLTNNCQHPPPRRMSVQINVQVL